MGSLPDDALQQAYLKQVQQAGLEAAEQIERHQRKLRGEWL